MSHRRHLAACAGLVLALLAPAGARAAEVFIRESKLFYRAGPDAPALELPAQQPLQAAALSPDGRWIVYQSVRAGMLLDGGNGQAFTVRTHIMRTDGTQAQTLSTRSPLAGPAAVATNLLPTLAYTRDGTALYFTGDDDHVARFHLATGQRTRLCAGDFAGLFPHGDEAGWPVVWRAASEGDSMREPWIVDEAGRPVRALTDDERRLLSRRP